MEVYKQCWYFMRGEILSIDTKEGMTEELRRFWTHKFAQRGIKNYSKGDDNKAQYDDGENSIKLPIG